MKLLNIKTDNILGARNISIQTATPITLICGHNGAAKSSIQEAVRMALTAETVRVELKRDYPSMISEGAKEGSIFVETDIGTGLYELPAGTHTLEGDLKLGIPDALPFVLNAQSFASMSEEKRRTFLFALTGCKVTTEEVRRRLTEKKCDSDKIELTLPLLRSGFPAAADFAAKKATESKGAWRGITGGTWGSKKGETWEAEKPDVDTERKEVLEAELSAAVELMNMRRQSVGAAEQRETTRKDNAAKLAEAKTKAAALKRHQEKLAHDENALKGYLQEAEELAAKAGTAPRTGLIHDLANALYALMLDLEVETQVVSGAQAAITQYVSQYGEINAEGDPEALAKLPALKKSVDLMERAVANTKRDIAAAQAAQEVVNNAQQEEADDTDIDGIKASMNELQGKIDEINTELNNLIRLDEANKTADEKTTKAAAHHTDVLAWEKVAEYLAPDGIPAEMLAQALKPINTILRKSAMATNWRQVTIGSDMSIKAEGRAYNLHCESEKWRIDAMIAEAIAELSGIKIFMLDRMDVLDINGRGELLGWLDDLANEDKINTALLFATLKQMPTGLPESITPIWIDNGVIAELGQAAA